MAVAISVAVVIVVISEITPSAQYRLVYWESVIFLKNSFIEVCFLSSSIYLKS